MKKRSIYKKCATMLVSVLLMSALCASFAQEMTADVYAAPADTQTDTPAQTDTALLDAASQDAVTQAVLASDPSQAPLPTELDENTLSAPYSKQFEFTQNRMFSGIYKTYGFYFNVPSYWQTQYAMAHIEFDVSPLIVDVPASLTFSVNSTPVYSCRVDYTYGSTQTADVAIPVDLLNEGYNVFSISGYVRIYDEEGCLDDFSGANWVNVTADSQIDIGYDVIETNNILSYYPYPFVSTVDETGAQCAVYVPENAADEELAAALLLRADLGGDTSETDEIMLQSLTSFNTDAYTKRVVVALRKNLPAEISGVINAQGRSLADTACIEEITLGDATVLVITSDSEAALYEGAALVTDASRVAQELANVAYVANGTADKVKQNSALSDLTAENYTVEGITGAGLTFTGPFRQEQEIILPLDGGFVLAEGGKATLNFRYSDNLDFDRSLVTVYWGTVPIASKKLEYDYAGGDTLSFVMPSDIVGTYASSITVAFDLEIPDLYCTKRADEMPWAYVTGDSTLYLPSGQASKYSFDLRPYPFQTLGLFNTTYVVLPDEMTAAELNLAGRVISAASSNLSPYGTLNAVRASKFNAQSTDANIILIGTYNDNSTLAALNDNLSFAYKDGGTAFADNAKQVLGETYSQTVGTMQLIRSPYFASRAVLAVCGTNDETLARIGEYLKEQENLWKLTGDTVIIDSRLEATSYTFLTAETAKTVSLAERLAQHKNAVIFTLISTLAMLLLLLAVILIAVRTRRNKNNESK